VWLVTVAENFCILFIFWVKMLRPGIFDHDHPGLQRLIYLPENAITCGIETEARGMGLEHLRRMDPKTDALCRREQ